MSDPDFLDTNGSTLGSYPKICVAIISKGRPASLGETLRNVLLQSKSFTQLLVVVCGPDDIPAGDFPPQVRFLISEVGITVQRNFAFRNAPPDTDYMAYFDDDMELRIDYLDQAARFIRGNPAVVAFSGLMLADGGVTRSEAKVLIDRYPRAETYLGNFQSSGKHHILYGCNMVIRRALLEYEPFDENMPLYSLDDYDISIRLKRYGFLGRFKGAIGVHLKESSSRLNEYRLAYTLVANNWYLTQKRVTHLPRPVALFRFWVRCVAHPMLEALWSLLRRDRTKNGWLRLRGTCLAVVDIFQNKCSPKRILEL